MSLRPTFAPRNPVPIQLQLGQNPEPIDPAQAREKRRQTRFWTGVALVVAALSFVMVLRLYAFEGTVVTSGSMEPTLYKGDYAVFDHRVALRGRWNRGDVVIFQTPPSWEGGGDEGSEEAGSFRGQTLVKRIIGLPGETVALLGGVVSINGQPLLGEIYIKDAPDPNLQTNSLKLGPGQYFVMGDNRNNSDDSRGNGPISETDITGRVGFRLWPPSRLGAMPSIDYGAFSTNN